MDKLKLIYKKLKSPTPKIAALSYISAVIFITLALLMLFVDYEGTALEILAYISYGCAALTLSYSVYLTVLYAPGLSGKVIAFLDSKPFTNRLLRNWGFRTVVTASVSFALGIAYSLTNAYLGISERSIWFGALAAYYILIAVMRGSLLIYHRRRGGYESEELTRARNYMKTGILLFILNAALSSAIAQMIFDDRSFDYKDWFIYAFAAYTFYKITMAILNFLRARRQDNLTIQAIRDINLVDSAVSILALQTALLHTFTTPDSGVDISLFNTLTGSVVSIFSITISILMIRKGNKIIKEIKKSNAGQQ